MRKIEQQEKDEVEEGNEVNVEHREEGNEVDVDREERRGKREVSGIVLPTTLSSGDG